MNLFIWLPDGADEENRLLRNDGQFAPEVIKSNISYVDPINNDGTSCQLHESKECDTQRGLSWRNKKKSLHYEV